MKIIDFIKSFFKKKNIELPSVLLSLNSMVSIPTREELENDKMIDQYKMTYIDTLNKEGTLSSVDIYTKELKNTMDMYIEILLMLVTGEDREILMEEMNFGNDDYKSLNLTIDILKLKNYLVEIENLKEEIKCRLVALNEIQGEFLNREVELRDQIEIRRKSRIRNTISLRKLIDVYRMVVDKVNVVNQGINHLCCSCLVAENQSRSIGLEVSRRLDNIGAVDTELTDKEQKRVAREKLEKVKDLASSFIPSEVEKISKSSLEDKLKIVLIESELEKYVFKNKDQVEEFKNEVNNLLKLQSEYNIKDVEVLDRVKVLENKFKVFDYYGDNLVERESLEKLYTLKFNSIVRLLDQGNNISFIDENTNYAEMEYYNKIIMDKIDFLVRSFKPDGSSMSTYNCVEFLKNDNDEFNAYDILSNPILSKFLILFFYCSLRKENAFNKLLEFKVERKDFLEIDFCEDIFTWNDEVSIAALCLLFPFSDIQDKHLKLLSEWYHEELNSQICSYKLPEGLERIDLSKGYLLKNEYVSVADCLSNNLISQNAKELLKYLNEKMLKKILFLPSTMKEIYGNPFSNAELKDVILYEGIETLCGGAFADVKIEHLYIPSSLKYIDDDVFDLEHLKYLIFENYDNSYLLSQRIAENCAKCNFFERIFKRVPVAERHIENSDLDALLMYTTYIKYSIEMNPLDIVLENSDGKIFHIEKKDISWQVETNVTMPMFARNDEDKSYEKVHAYAIVDSDEVDYNLYTFEEMIRVQMLKEVKKKERLESQHKKLCR